MTEIFSKLFLCAETLDSIYTNEQLRSYRCDLCKKIMRFPMVCKRKSCSYQVCEKCVVEEALIKCEQCSGKIIKDVDKQERIYKMKIKCIVCHEEGEFGAHFQSCGKSFVKINKASTREVNAFQNLLEEIDILKLDISKIRSTIEILEIDSVDQVLWRIPDFYKKLMKGDLIESPILKIFKYGYNIQLQMIYISEEDKIEFGLTILKSEFDPILTWPINRNFLVEIINLKDKSENFKDILSVNDFTNSFKRPSGRNEVATVIIPNFFRDKSISKWFLDYGTIYLTCTLLNN